MQDDQNTIRNAAERVIKLEAELESTGEASVSDAAVIAARAVLHAWVDTVTAVVSSPGLGRVTLIHANGRQSGIASPELPFLLSTPTSGNNRQPGTNSG
jgi:hypothetical protein